MLHGQQAAGRAGREFALHRREDALDQSPAPIEAVRKRPPHFGTHPAHAPGFLPALGRDHTLRSESLPDVGVIPLAVEFGIGQHQPDACLLGSRSRRPLANSRSRSKGRAAPSAPARTADPSRPRRPTSASTSRAAVFARDDAGVGQRRCSPPPTPSRWHRPPPGPAFDRPALTPCNRRTVSPTARSSVRSSTRWRKRYSVVKSGTLLNPRAWRSSRVLPQAHFRFAKSPVLVPHQAQDGQKLRLRELVLAEGSPIGWEHRPAHFPGGAGKCSTVQPRPSRLRPPSKRTLAKGWRTQILLGWSKDVNRTKSLLVSTF